MLQCPLPLRQFITPLSGRLGAAEYLELRHFALQPELAASRGLLTADVSSGVSLDDLGAQPRRNRLLVSSS